MLMLSLSAEPKPHCALMDDDIRVLQGMYNQKIGFMTP